MPPPTRVLLSLCPLLLAADLAVSASAAEHKVTPVSLAETIDRAGAGDTLLLTPGLYRDRLKIEKPLTLRGQAGAVFNGSSPLKAEWSPAGTELKNVFTTPLKNRPRGLLLKGKFMAEIRFDRAKKSGEWNWRTLLAKGTPLSGFDEIRSLWIYHPEEQRLYARFENAADPSGLDLSVVSSEEPLIHIEDTSRVTIEGLAFSRAAEAIVLGEGASDCVIRKCRVTSFESTGIALVDGASRCTVEDCEISRGSLEEWTPSAKHSRPNYEIWRLHKEAGNYDRNGIEIIRAGTGNRILRNHLHHVFDGVALGDYKAESLDKPLPDPDHGRGTEIAHNLIENTRDSGIELGVGCIDVNVHHNTLRQTHGGLRFKLPRIGPIFIHHNRLIEGAPFGIWFSMDASPAEAYVYHNTIVAGEHEALSVAKDSMKRDSIAPRWHFVNNLVLSDKGFCEPSDKSPLDFTASHNVVTGSIRPWPDDASKDKGSVYGVDIKHDKNGKPAAGSAAVDAGMDLSTYLKGKPLPGCEPGSYRGKAPDAGADEASPP